MAWLISKKQKVHQRRINKYVRRLNKNIELDKEWQGRFYLRQFDSPIFVEYFDKSGAELYVKFKLFDKITNKTAFTGYNSANHWCFLTGIHLFEIMNKFIIEVVEGVPCSSSDVLYY